MGLGHVVEGFGLKHLLGVDFEQVCSWHYRYLRKVLQPAPKRNGAILLIKLKPNAILILKIRQYPPDQYLIPVHPIPIKHLHLLIPNLNRLTIIIRGLYIIKPMIDEYILTFYKTQVIDNELEVLVFAELNFVLGDFIVLANCTNKLGWVLQADYDFVGSVVGGAELLGLEGDVGVVKV